MDLYKIKRFWFFRNDSKQVIINGLDSDNWNPVDQNTGIVLSNNETGYLNKIRTAQSVLAFIASMPVFIVLGLFAWEVIKRI